jgi:hypothetical protein
MMQRAPSILTATMTTTGLTALLTTPAIAHPGHGLDTTGVGLQHFLLQPSHGGIALLVAIVLVAASIAVKRRRHG